MVQLLHQPSLFFVLMTYSFYKQTSIDNWIAAEGQSSYHSSSWSYHSSCVVGWVPPNCPPSCLLRLLRACHLCKPSFLAKLKCNYAEDPITSPQKGQWKKLIKFCVCPSSCMKVTVYYASHEWVQLHVGVVKKLIRLCDCPSSWFKNVTVY